VANFVYDLENRMVIATGAKPATLTHDSLGRLWPVDQIDLQKCQTFNCLY